MERRLVPASEQKLLILLALGGKKLARLRFVYPLTVGLTSVESIVAALGQAKIHIPLLSDVLAALPLAEQSLGWVLPAVVGFAAGVVLSLCFPSQKLPEKG